MLRAKGAAEGDEMNGDGSREDTGRSDNGTTGEVIDEEQMETDESRLAEAGGVEGSADGRDKSVRA